MATAYTSDELQALIKFPFEDPDWKNKFLIGSLLTFAGFVVPVIPLIFVQGYCAQIMRRIIKEKGKPFLPVWDDWGQLFSDGLKVIGVGLVYSLPFLILFCASYAILISAIIGAEAMSGPGSSDPEELPPAATILPLMGFLIWIVMFGLVMVGVIVVSAIRPVAVGHVIATDEFAAAFRIREWWPIFRINLGGYLISYALIFGAYLVLSFALQILYVTIIFCCLIPFVMPVIILYFMLIGSVLFGQAYRDGMERLAGQTTIAPVA
jgi:hypothetical protein